jgi:hypothetical protein
MNIFELAVAAAVIASGVCAGYFASKGIGILGWILGVPLGCAIAGAAYGAFSNWIHSDRKR